MGQILTNELDKTSTNVATWHELKTKPRNDDEQRTTTRRRRKEKYKEKEKKNKTPNPNRIQSPPKETERANNAKAILRTWLQGRVAGAVSPPASCGNARRTSKAVLGKQWRPVGGRPAGGPGPR